MKRNYLFAALIFITFITVLSVCLVSAESDAAKIREGVLRFHIVANSDSESDQLNKMSVRDGIAELCSELFYSAESKEEAMRSAVSNRVTLENAAREILLERGCYDTVSLSLTKRYFPTRHYEGVSLPAGVYDTVDVIIGEGQGKNFWCVMFPDICIGASSDLSNREKMADVLDGGSLEMATDGKQSTVAFRFKLVEIFEGIKNFFNSTHNV